MGKMIDDAALELVLDQYQRLKKDQAMLVVWHPAEQKWKVDIQLYYGAQPPGTITTASAGRMAITLRAVDFEVQGVILYGKVMGSGESVGIGGAMRRVPAITARALYLSGNWQEWIGK